MLFEPLPSHVEHLKKAYSEPGFVIHEVALGRDKTVSTLYEPSTASGKTTWSSLLRSTDEMALFDKERGVSSEGTAIQVPVCPLDDYAQQAPCALKIDVEGSEFDVLYGATNVLSQCQLLIIELSIFHRFYGEGEFAEIVSFLHAKGFELFDIPLLGYPLRDRDLTLIDAIFVPVADRRAGGWIQPHKS